MISIKSLRLRCIEMLRLHVNLLSMVGLREKFDHGILLSILLLLFSVENHAIENKWKKIRMDLMSMHFFRHHCFYNTYRLTYFINSTFYNQHKTVNDIWYTMYTSIYISIYLYLSIHLSISLYMYIYIYISKFHHDVVFNCLPQFLYKDTE